MLNFVDCFEIIKDRLYFATQKRNNLKLPQGEKIFCFTSDDKLRYDEYCDDFGPLSLGKTYIFCRDLHLLLKEPECENKVIYYISSNEDTFRNNSAVLICAYSILCLGKTAEQALKPLESPSRPFIFFHDASYFPNQFDLSVEDCVNGLYKAYTLNWFKGGQKKQNGKRPKKRFLHKFNVEEYENYCNLQMGDLNWLVQKQFVAFAGPLEQKKHIGNGYYSFTPSDYIPYLKSKSVKLIIRLNQKMYKASHFKKAGIHHEELFYPDGGNPPMEIIHRFIELCEKTIFQQKGAVGVHCKAGLGRTGTCIGLFLMKHYDITAKELIGYFRIARPGSVIGPQQQFLVENEARMKKLGRIYREKGLTKGLAVSKNRTVVPNVAEKDGEKFDDALDFATPGSPTQGDILNEKKLRSKGVKI
eukprot:augustus_masked-scaffold_15-processed-gene-8.21-mRNA-1 protein AED:0.02 eAED:0.02 QI:0/-1/0/1/-1/1/1/0/415